mmetsp:Transcript_26444/g.29250  ORF Transcript_26444/g.29250 Transcript_26444/m.29250 type:complete len:591 (+) Transcript_26444:437-2209(+)
MKLGHWLNTQLQQRKKRKLDEILEKRLEDLGVEWDLLSEHWENYYRLLVRFKQREGHSNVPYNHIEDDMKLGRWFVRQKEQKKKGRLDKSLQKQLEDVGVIWNYSLAQWDFHYRLLVKFQQREGHSNACFSHTEDGKYIGRWLAEQRKKKKKEKLDKSLVKKLEDVGVTWDPHSEQQENNIRLLLQFRERKGHLNVPHIHVEEGVKLGQWLAEKRSQRGKGKLDKNLEKRLEDAGIVWKVYSERWEDNYRLFVKFQEREGHSNITKNHIEDDMKLGLWLLKQRHEKKTGKLDSNREERLEEVGMVWDPLLEQWEKSYRILQKFQEREGHSNVPYYHVEDGINLGCWLYGQRQNKRKGKLDRRHEQRLEDVGIVWDVYSERWENNYRHLVKFQEREGHVNISTRYIEDGVRVGDWLNKQRGLKKTGKLEKSLEQRLENLGVVWEVLSEQWEKNYRLLVEFQAREGHAAVPASYTEDGINVGAWLSDQRLQKKNGKLDSRREKRLLDVGVVWYRDLHLQWENNYFLLIQFLEREGHPNVPQSHIEDGVNLGTWLSRQRLLRKKGKLDSNYEERLDELGVIWVFFHEINIPVA